MKYAEVILPLNVQGTFTYSIPEDMQPLVLRGSRVFVQFGSKKYYTGIVDEIHDRAPEGYDVKPIMLLNDQGRSITRYPQINFWQWVADYYLCTIGEVYRAAVPTSLKVESETFISAVSDYEFPDDVKLTERQAIVYQYLSAEKQSSVSEIEKRSGLRNVAVAVNQLMEMGAVEVAEKAVDKYRPKMETFVTLSCARDDGDTLHGYFDKLTRSRSQERMLVAYIDRSKWLLKEQELKEVSRSEILKASGTGPSILKALIDKGIFTTYRKEINLYTSPADNADNARNLSPLSPVQEKALQQIYAQMREHGVTLLRGVTGSGKTEIYTHMINRALSEGKQVLYLVPEIALTTQLTGRLSKIFGDKMVVYHSKFSDSQRARIYKRMCEKSEPMLVVGVRSSVFLPFSFLGLVIVDEEHEASYKQYDPAPRYNARDAAIVLASFHGAKTLLGSATPAIETYYKAMTGKYGLVNLLERYGEATLPDIEIIDIKEQRRKKRMHGPISEPMQAAMSRALQEGYQTLMFQNRRGFAPMVVCKECAWTPKCRDCDVSMVYHKGLNQLRCHYCGYSIALPPVCPVCGLPGIETFGYGTERIAESLHEQFEDYRVSRMDQDTTRSKDSYQEIIEEFAKGDTDILVGTQMVSKGLDFEKVKIVGVINADTMLNFPDFRSNERAFNMLMQVAGRAGRRKEKGKVIIQASEADNEVLQFVKRHDYEGFYELEISDRKKFNYPPFYKVINIVLRHKDSAIVDSAAVAFTNALITLLGAKRVFGPERPFVSRISTYYIQQIMIKIEVGASMRKVKDLLRQVYEQLLQDRRYRTVMLHYDVDPV